VKKFDSEINKIVFNDSYTYVGSNHIYRTQNFEDWEEVLTDVNSTFNDFIVYKDTIAATTLDGSIVINSTKHTLSGLNNLYKYNNGILVMPSSADRAEIYFFNTTSFEKEPIDVSYTSSFYPLTSYSVADSLIYVGFANYFGCHVYNTDSSNWKTLEVLKKGTNYFTVVNTTYAKDSIFVAVTGKGVEEVFYSEDYGKTGSFAALPSTATGSFNRINIRSFNKKIFVVYENSRAKGLIVSEDKGNSWTNLLVDSAVIDLNFRNDTLYALTSNNCLIRLPQEGTKPDTNEFQSINLNKGWNLFSLYIEPIESNIGNIFPNASIIKDFESFYSAEVQPELNSLEKTIPYSGYMLYNTTSEDISIEGSLAETQRLELKKGWNLIGYYGKTGLPVDSALFQIRKFVEVVKDLDEFYMKNYPYYLNSLDSLTYGDIYYVKVSENCSLQWTFPQENPKPLQTDFNTHILEEYFVKSIAFDNLGNAWIGTFKQGLIKYNPRETIVYNSENSLITDDVIYDIAVDSKNNVWIACKGIIKYDGNSFTHYSPSNTPMPENNVMHIEVDSKDNIWFSSCVHQNGGLVKFDGESWVIFTPDDSELPTNLINDIAVSKNDDIWVTTHSNTLSKISNNTLTTYSFDSLDGYMYSLDKIAFNKKNDIYIGINNGAFSGAIGSCKECSKILIFDELKSEELYNESIQLNIESMIIDSNDNMWGINSDYYTMYNGINWIVNGKSIGEESLFTIAQSLDGKIWIGTGRGIYIND